MVYHVAAYHGMNGRESAYQMKMRNVTFSIFLTLAGLCHAGADDPLLSLANGWGKGTIIDFRKTVYKNVPALANKGGAEAVEKWCLDLLGYPDLLEETETRYWMQAKVSTIDFCIRMHYINTSTNCWFAAAELLSRYRAMARVAESNASVKVDYSLTKTNPKRYNELLYGRKPLKIKAWNLKHAETSLARVVTNEFPKSVLPLLPESERDKMMSEVLERSGLKSSNEDEGGSLISQHCRLTIVSVIVCSFALGGCILGCRFKRRNAGGQ